MSYQEYPKLDELRARVCEVLGEDESGHGLDHVDRVYKLAVAFADEISGDIVDKNILTLGAYLHDVDDYKLVGHEHAKKLTNTRHILDKLNVREDDSATVLGIVSTIGYSKALRGIRPTSIEGKLISDADMNDALGVSGILRAFQYAVSDKGSGVVFNPTVWPNIEMTAEQYNAEGTTHKGDSFVNHHYEKLLKLPEMMLTGPGKREALHRREVMSYLLREYYRENNVPEWIGFHDDFMSRRAQ